MVLSTALQSDCLKNQDYLKESILMFLYHFVRTVDFENIKFICKKEEDKCKCNLDSQFYNRNSDTSYRTNLSFHLVRELLPLASISIKQFRQPCGVSNHTYRARHFAFLVAYTRSRRSRCRRCRRRGRRARDLIRAGNKRHVHGRYCSCPRSFQQLFNRDRCSGRSRPPGELCSSPERNFVESTN